MVLSSGLPEIFVNNSQRINNKIALVTGSSRGIGKNIALCLAGKVSGVVVHYRKNEEEAQKTVAEIRETGAESEAFQADLTDEQQALAFFQKVEKKLGRIDILVNNVGPLLVKPWKNVNSQDWDRIFAGNFKTALFGMKAVLPGMHRRGWGRIINLGYSRAEQLTAFPTITPYAVAKTGLLILTRTAAKTEGKSGVTINMVSPGLIENGVLPVCKDIPLSRQGTFEDVSEAVGFLASEEAGYITGVNLVVAGGWRL